MSDLGEAFGAWRAMKQAKRASNREQSKHMLEQAGISFETHNDGVHLIVQAGRMVVDFWPGTGLWIVRGLKIQRRRRGVRELIKYINSQTETKP